MGHSEKNSDRISQWIPLAISSVINLALIVVVLKIGVFPKIRFSEDTGIKVSLENFFTPEPAPPPPIQQSSLPSFGTLDITSPSEDEVKNLTQESVIAPPSPLKITPPSLPVTPPRPILTTAPSQRNTIQESTLPSSKQIGVATSARDSGNGSSSQGAGGSNPDQKKMIGDLLIPEEKLMAIMPNLQIPGPVRAMVPTSYKTAIRNRAKDRFFEVKIKSHGAALDDEFVSAVIEFAERCQPEAIYWLHWTLYGEYPPARARLIEWLKQRGIPLYVSSWDIPLSKDMQEAILNSGGSYEQRNTFNRPIMTIRATPSGTKYITEEIKKNNQWSPSMQKEEGTWEAIIVSIDPNVRARGKKEELIPEPTRLSVSVVDSSRSIELYKNHLDPDSWAAAVAAFRGKGDMYSSTSADVMVFSRNGNTTQLSKKDKKTGKWEKITDPRPEDLMPERSPLQSNE